MNYEQVQHSVCGCDNPSQPSADHRCECGSLSRESMYWAIQGTDPMIGWIGPFLAVLKARAA